MPAEQRPQRRRPRVAADVVERNRGQQHDSDGEQQRAGRVDRRRAGDVDEAAEAGPAMIAVCVAVALVATARGSSAGGTSAGSSAAIVGISNARAAPMTNTTAKIRRLLIHPCEAAGGEDQRRGRLRRDAQPHDAAAIVPIGDVAHREEQHHRRQELDQSDQPEVERAARELIHLPADCDGQHLVAHDAGDPREPEQPKARWRKMECGEGLEHGARKTQREVSVASLVWPVTACAAARTAGSRRRSRCRCRRA